jgi:hypothetical protein
MRYRYRIAVKIFKDGRRRRRAGYRLGTYYSRFSTDAVLRLIADPEKP